MNASSPAADLVILNGAIHTLEDSRPRAEAIAIHGNRIGAVGSTAEIRSLVHSATRVIDAEGRVVLPGFNDAHVHFLTGGFSLANVDLRDASSPREMAQRIGEYANTLAKGRWILGGDWDHEKWPGAPLPNKADVDAVTPEHPLFVTRLDEHMALANSLALRLAGINASTADPPGGLIARDPNTGEPTGVLKDAAMSLVERVLPAKTFEEKCAAARAATEHAARLGVTSLTDMSADHELKVYQHLLERGELKCRIYAAHSIRSWEKLAQAGVRAACGNDLLRLGAVKGFADGSLGSSTARFFEPYADAPGNRGLWFDQMLPEGVMLERVLGADRAGLQVFIHAIGDEANCRILDIFREAASVNGARDRRFRIEHAQHLRPSEIPRFATQKVIASIQPYHAADDGRWCEKRIGTERSRGAYAFRSLIDSGAALAFGSDWTVAPLNPLAGIQAAVTRQTLDGRNPDGWLPEQKIPIEEAVRAYTLGSAYAEFSEQVKGTIRPGKLADLVILDRDIYRLHPTEIDKARVMLTIMNGQIVYAAT